MKFNELQEEIELTNYECVDNKTVFIVCRTYKGKRNLKDIISQHLLEEIDAQNEWYYLDDNSLECWFSSGKKCSDEICVNKKNYETYPGLVVYPKWVKLYTQLD